MIQSIGMTGGMFIHEMMKIGGLTRTMTNKVLSITG